MPFFTITQIQRDDAWSSNEAAAQLEAHAQQVQGHRFVLLQMRGHSCGGICHGSPKDGEPMATAYTTETRMKLMIASQPKI